LLFTLGGFGVGKLENEVDISKFVGKVESLKIFEFPKNVKNLAKILNIIIF